MDILKIALEVFLAVTGVFLVFLILAHKGKGGGMSDMFGGAMSSTMGGSSVAERNLNRITVGMALVWLAAIVGLGLVVRFQG
ncbi:preprotein translocase subunit SecG [Mobilicoccus pelagius]|uniref:Protein-export membrane protein SecG n=1 Tax=Mobilicoccus pelagius NBRC 104925 TaxID=1089455 RepID=H5UTN8_9MICO|nr:preprotein translocase subunit SecG [Mobilicoccus pelagius]GAB49096.1 protein-export membrane protein SecG [Mobilicoccus pelagius NBRC 104925]